MPLYNEVDLFNVGGVDNDIRDSYTRAMIAGIETETYSTHAYDINKFFIWNDRHLYKVKSAISVGDTFVLNTNIELAGTISDQLYYLFTQSTGSVKSIISNVENTANASRNFAIDEQFIWTDGYLYKVIATTILGTAWNVGTNCELADNITEQLRNIRPVLNLADLNDVDIDPLTLEDGQALVYNNLTGKYENRDIGGSVGELVTVPAGNPLVFETESEQVAQDVVVTFEPIQAGTGDPSPSNVRPINGYNKLVIDSNYTTQITSEAQNGLYNYETGVFIENNTFAYISVEIDDTNSHYCLSIGNIGAITAIVCFDQNNNYITGFTDYDKKLDIYDFTIPNNTKYIVAETGGSLKPITKDTVGYIYLQKIYSNVSNPFPETIYRGTLDVESGKLVVDKGSVLIGSLTWTYSSAYSRFQSSTIRDMKSMTIRSMDIVSDSYKAVIDPSMPVGNIPNNSIYNDLDKIVFVHDNRYTTASDFVSAMGTSRFVYELATPITYYLTPCQISLLKGSNTVVTNGTTITLTYRAGEVASLEDVGNVAKRIDPIQGAAYAMLDVYGSKNLNSYPYHQSSVVLNGITFTDNGDGSITVSGTASANANFGLHHNTNEPNKLYLKKGNYIVSGCPSGGANDKYYLSIWTSELGYVNDYGNEETFTISTDNTAIWFVISIKSGTTITTPITFYPMIRDARIIDNTFVPYAKTNRELTKDSQKIFSKEQHQVNTNSLTLNNVPDGAFILIVTAYNDLGKSTFNTYMVLKSSTYCKYQVLKEDYTSAKITAMSSTSTSLIITINSTTSSSVMIQSIHVGNL